MWQNEANLDPYHSNIELILPKWQKNLLLKNLPNMAENNMNKF